MKKSLKYVFICIIAVLALAMVVHVTLLFISIGNNPYTSAPASIAFLLIIPYAIAITVAVTVWYIIRIRQKKCNK